MKAISQHIARVAPLVAMALPLILLFHRALFLGDVLVAGDALQLSPPWAISDQMKEIQNWYPFDSVYQFYPSHWFLREELTQRELPLWNPYSFSGHPLLADGQSGILDPFNVLYLLLNFSRAYSLRLILQLYAAGVFAYLFLRVGLRVSRVAALLGGTLYMLNGVFVAWLEWQRMVGGALWLPLILLLLERAWATRRYLYAGLAGAALGGSLLGGTIQHALATMLTVLLYALVATMVRDPKSTRVIALLRRLSFAIVACGTGIVLGAIQLLPTLQLLTASQRRVFQLMPLLLEWVGKFPKNFFLSIAFLIDFINPYFTGNAQSLDFRTLITWPEFGGNIVEYQGYVGVLALILAGTAIVFHRTRTAAVPLYMACIVLFLSLATPANLFLYYRWLFAYAFFVSVLAAIGIDYLISSDVPSDVLAAVNRTLTKLLSILIGVLVIGNLTFYLWGPGIRNFGRAYMEHHIRNYLFLTNNANYVFARLEALYENYSITSPTMYVPVLTLAATIAAFTLYRRQILSKRLFGLACIYVATGELLYFGLTFIPSTKPVDLFPPTDVTDFLKGDHTLFRILPFWEVAIDPPILPPNTNMPYKLQSVGGYDSVFPRRYADFMKVIDSGSLASLKEKSYTSFRLTRYDNRLLDMMNVKYVLAGRHRELESSKFHRVFAGSLRVYENKEALPRVFVVPRARVIRDDRTLLASLLDRHFDPRREVLLEKDPSESMTGSGAFVENTAEVLAYLPHRVLIKAHIAENGFLVLADAYSPDWRVLMNGRDVPVYRANYVLRAVALPQGDHTVEFLYEPQAFRVGTWISAVGCLLLAAALMRELFLTAAWPRP